MADADRALLMMLGARMVHGGSGAPPIPNNTSTPATPRRLPAIMTTSNENVRPRTMQADPFAVGAGSAPAVNTSPLRTDQGPSLRGTALQMAEARAFLSSVSQGRTRPSRSRLPSQNPAAAPFTPRSPQTYTAVLAPSSPKSASTSTASTSGSRVSAQPSTPRISAMTTRSQTAAAAAASPQRAMPGPVAPASATSAPNGHVTSTTLMPEATPAKLPPHLRPAFSAVDKGEGSKSATTTPNPGAAPFVRSVELVEVAGDSSKPAAKTAVITSTHDIKPLPIKSATTATPLTAITEVKGFGVLKPAGDSGKDVAKTAIVTSTPDIKPTLIKPALTTTKPVSIPEIKGSESVKAAIASSKPAANSAMITSTPNIKPTLSKSATTTMQPASILEIKASELMKAAGLNGTDAATTTNPSPKRELKSTEPKSAEVKLTKAKADEVKPIEVKPVEVKPIEITRSIENNSKPNGPATKSAALPEAQPIEMSNTTADVVKGLQKDVAVLSYKIGRLEAENWEMTRKMEELTQAEERRKFLGTVSAKSPFSVRVVCGDDTLIVQVTAEMKIADLIRRVRVKAEISAIDSPCPRILMDGEAVGHGMMLGELGVKNGKKMEFVFDDPSVAGPKAT